MVEPEGTKVRSGASATITAVQRAQFMHPHWPVRLLGDVADVGSGVTLGRSLSGSNTVEVPYLRVANVQDGYLDLSELKTVRVYKKDIERFRLQSGDVLMNEGGDFDKLGRGCVWEGQIGECLHQNHVFRVRTNPIVLLPRFLALVSTSAYGKRYFVLSSKQTTNLASINSTQLRAFPVPCPPLDEQLRIVEIVGAADATIQQAEVLIAKLKLMRAGLLRDLLTRGVGDDNRVRERPATWKLAPLESVASVERGKFSHRPRNDPRFYGGRHPFIQTGDVAANESKVVAEPSQWLNDRGASVSREFPAGTIAVSIAANIADTTILGRPMFFPDSVVGVNVHAPHNTRYVELCLRMAKAMLDARAPQSAQKNINLQDLRPLQIPIPDPGEQARIAFVYDAHDALIRAEETYRDKLKLQKQGLMHDLLTGKVRVKP